MAEELDFNELLIAKRHKELVSALKAILDKISDTPQEKPDKELKRILSSIDSYLKDPAESALVSEIRSLTESLKTPAKPTENESGKEWTFHINRDSNGFIESVQVIKD